MLILIVVSIIFILLIYISIDIFLYRKNKKKNIYDLLNFLEKNKKDLSVTIIENDVKTLEYNGDVKVPLASTVKLIVAYHFVKAITMGKLKPDEEVSLSDVDRFYIARTDGGAHKAWINISGIKNKVTLLDIAKGMMQFSSNACTDFLIDKIGLNNINKGMSKLDIIDHDDIFPLTPNILTPSFVLSSKRTSLKKIKTMSDADYRKLISEIFELMKNNNKGKMDLEKRLFKKRLLGFKMQSILTQKMTYSTTNEYSKLMLRFYKDLLTVKEKEMFDNILFGRNLIEEKDHCFWFKSGATPFVLTSALLKGSSDNSIAISLFINDKRASNSYWIQNIFNDFVVMLAKDKKFREKLILSLKD